MARLPVSPSGLVRDILGRTKNAVDSARSGGTSYTSQGSGSSSQSVHISGGGSAYINQGVNAGGSSSGGTRTSAPSAPSSARARSGGRGGGGGRAGGGGGGGGGRATGGSFDPAAPEDGGFQFDPGAIDSTIQQARDQINQDAALDDEEKALALQELETQANFARQQYALIQEHYNEQIGETNRQLPITQRDIGDEYAAQGAFYSGRREFDQAEAQHQAQLAISGLQRQLRGEDLSQQEREALTAIGRQKIELAGKRDDLQTAADLFDLEHSRDLTPDQLVSGLEQGIITSAQLTQGLQSLGYSQNEAQYLTKLAQSGMTQGHLSEGQLAAAYEAGVIDKKTLESSLQKLGYSPQESSILSKTIDAAHQTTTGGKQVTASQLESAYRAGVITQADYISGLQGLGYPKDQAQLLAATAAKKGPLGGSTAAKSVGKTDLEQAYKLGLISKDNLIQGLVNLGYPKADATGLATIAEAEKAKSAKTGSSSGKNLSKDEWKSLYGQGAINKTDLIQGLQSLGYSKDQASAIAQTVKVQKAKTAATGVPTKDTTTVGGQVVSPARGAAMGDPTNYITEHYDSYMLLKNEVQSFARQLGRTPSIKDFVDWKVDRIILTSKGVKTDTPVKVVDAKGKSVPKRDSQGNVIYKYRPYTRAEAEKKLSQFAPGISLVWYRLFYGGEKAYPYHGNSYEAAALPTYPGKTPDTISVF